MQIKISNRIVWVDEADWSLFSKHPWHVESAHGYVVYRYNENSTKKKVYLHRLIMGSPKKKVVDHINGNKLDNRRKNLRLCSPHQNILNQNGSRGVCKTSDGKKWRAYVSLYDREAGRTRQISLGNYKTRKEAVIATVAGRKLLDTVYSVYNL